MSVQPALKCPYCDSRMIPGSAEIKGTLAGFLAVGFSNQHLWFRKGKRERSRILVSEDETLAHQCELCGAVAIPPRHLEPEVAERVSKRLSAAKRESGPEVQ